MGFGSFFSAVLSPVSSILGGGGGSGNGSSASNSTSNSTNITNSIDTKPIADAIKAQSESTNTLFKSLSEQSNAGLKHLDDTLIALIQSQNMGDMLLNDKSNNAIKYGLLLGGAVVAYHLTPKKGKNNE